MNSKNEKHFSRRLNIQVCELLKVLAEAAIERCFEFSNWNKCTWDFKHNK